MRNYLYTLLLLLFVTSSVYGQECVTTINGTSFHIGDDLTIGLPSRSDNTYHSIWTRSNQKWIGANQKLLPFSKAKLKRRILMKKHILVYNRPDTMYVLRHSQLPKDSMIIKFDEAERLGEIIVEPIQHQSLHPEAVELRPIDCIPALIKAGYHTYTDKMIKAYVKVKGDMKLFNAIMNSPFEYKRQRATLLAELQKAVENFDLNKVYYVKGSLYAGVYDFDLSGYPLESDWKKDLPSISDRGIVTNLLSKDKKEITFVKVPANRAENFEKRSRTLGKDSHPLYSKAYIRLLPKEGEPEDEDEDEGYDFPVLVGDFTVLIDYLGADLYEYPHCAYYHLGSSKAE